MKTRSIVYALALGLATSATAPMAFAQVSQAQINQAFTPSTPATASVPVHASPELDAAESRLATLTNVSELVGLPDGATLQEGVVQMPLTEASAVSDSAGVPATPELDAALSGIVVLSNAAELGRLPDGAVAEQGVVQIPVAATAFGTEVARVARIRQ